MATTKGESMTPDEASRQIASDLDKIDNRLAELKNTVALLKKNKESLISELRNIAAGGGYQERLDLGDGNDL